VLSDIMILLNIVMKHVKLIFKIVLKGCIKNLKIMIDLLSIGLINYYGDYIYFIFLFLFKYIIFLYKK
jgi:hypothetical protein